jgi:hypothetical protein
MKCASAHRLTSLSSVIDTHVANFRPIRACVIYLRYFIKINEGMKVKKVNTEWVNQALKKYNVQVIVEIVEI